LSSASRFGARLLVAVDLTQSLDILLDVGTAFRQRDVMIPNRRARPSPEPQTFDAPRLRSEEGGAGLL
jgi:hypothetical protein